MNLKLYQFRDIYDLNVFNMCTVCSESGGLGLSWGVFNSHVSKQFFSHLTCKLDIWANKCKTWNDHKVLWLKHLDKNPQTSIRVLGLGCLYWSTNRHAVRRIVVDILKKSLVELHLQCNQTKKQANNVTRITFVDNL